MSFTFDGFDLTQYAYARIDRPVGPSLRVDTEQVPGRDGEIYLGSTREPLIINARMTLKPQYIAPWASVRRTLAAALAKTSECRLTLPDEPDTYRMATASISDDVTTPLVHPVEFTIQFTCHSPIAYALVAKTEDISTYSGASITVGGTLPAMLSIESDGDNNRNTSTTLWGVRLDSQDYMRVLLPVYNSHVIIDADNHIVTLDGAAGMLTLDSNWLKASPGTHNLQMYPGGSVGGATVSWIERWL